MRLKVLGPLEAAGRDGPIPLGGPRQRAVLAQLIVQANGLVPADTLIDQVWGEEPPAAARSTLFTYVSHLRKALGPDRIESRGPGYVLRVGDEELDSARFERLVQEGRLAGSPGRAREVLREALALWTGPAFADLATEPSLAAEIARLTELRYQALEGRIAADLAQGRHGEVIGELEALTRELPLRERLWELLMLALYRVGRPADALASFERAKNVLAEELGVDPSSDLRRMHERILREDPELDLAGEALRGYRLLEPIGDGAFGVVYRAIQPQVGREVAIKAVHPELANHPDFIRRFEREAQIVARLEHPHIVPLYDYWREPDAAYLVMRFLRGGSVERLLDDGPLEPSRAAVILDHVAAALSAAHRQGVVHRDVKPGNILLDEEGNAYLTDFGVALDAGAPEKSSGTMMRGTPAYLSPEQIRLEAASPSSDIYALGIVAYEMLTREHPFPESSLTALLELHLSRPLPSVRGARPELGPAVDDVIARATAKDSSERFASVLDLAVAFREALEGTRSAREPLAPTRNPYKGLRAFLEADAGDFFGREALTRRLVDRLAETEAGSRFLAVVGPSGSGKSSVVRAGLVPAIRRGALPGSDAWFVVDALPGLHPLRELEAALLGVAVEPPPSLMEDLEADELGLVRSVERVLPDPESELVIVLDQLEEVFTLVEDEGERAHLLASLRSAVIEPGSRVRIVTTLRADFFDAPLSIRGFGELLAQRTEAITPMSAEELERAIVAPADHAGLVAEPMLVGAIIADVIDRPGALPLLQYALTELAERSADGVLLLDAYRRIGGVSGALARRSEQLFGALNQEGRDACRQLFLRLVAVGEGGEETRRRVGRSELAALSDARTMDGVVDAFGRHRLVSFDRDPDTREPTVEIAHEALLGAWDRLRGWIDDARDDIRSQRRLAATASEWMLSARDPSFLLRGSRLEQAEAWRSGSGIALTPEEGAYLDASRAERYRRQADEEARAAHERDLERRSVRRLRALVGVLAVAMVVAIALTIFATRESGRAAREERNASARELAAASVANLDVDPERSILLALEAVELTRSVDGTVLPEAEEALHRAVTASRIVLNEPDLGGALDWSPDGVFVTEGPENIGRIDIRSAATGASVRTWEGHNDVNDVQFSQDGSMLATSGDDGALRVWDPGSGELIAAVQEAGLVFGVSFDAGGSLVAASWLEGPMIRIARPATGEVVRTIDPPGLPVDTALSPDGERVVVGNFLEGVARVYDVATGEEILVLPGHRYSVTGVSWSPDGRLIATASGDSFVRVWNAETGELEARLGGHTGEVISVDWGPDSRRLVSGGSDGTARVWEVDEVEGREVFRLAAQQTQAATFAAFSPDGEQVLTGDVGISAVQIWDLSLQGDAEVMNLPTDYLAPVDVDTLPDGRIVASDREGSVSVWRTEGTHEATIGPGGGSSEPVSRIAASPEGGRIATVRNLSGVLSAWDVGTGDRVFEVDAYPSGDVSSIDWSPDGRYLAAGSFFDGRVTIFGADGERITVLEEPATNYIEMLAFSPGGRALAVATTNTEAAARGHVSIWDWDRGEVDQTIDAPATALAFDPTGSTLAVGLFDGNVEIRDVATGELGRGFRAHSGRVGDLAFSPDGRRLITTAPDGVVRVWTLDLDELIRIAEGEVTRELTDDECRQYLHLPERCP